MQKNTFYIREVIQPHDSDLKNHVRIVHPEKKVIQKHVFYKFYSN
jgi:hypothetical protein